MSNQLSKQSAIFGPVSIIIIIATVLVYWPGIHGPFLFDDDPNIVRNAGVHLQTLDLDGVRAAALSGHSGPLKRPISMLSFALNHYLHGLDPFWFKTTNLVIHVLTGLALALLTLLLLRTPALQHVERNKAEWISLAIAAAWLLHPFNLTPVLYVVQRMSALSSLFVVLGLIAYAHSRLRMIEGQNAWLSLVLGTGVFFVLAILSKESGALIFVYLLSIEYTLLRFSARNSNNQRLLIGLWTVALVALVSMIAVYFYQHPNWVDQAYSFRSFGLNERLLTESRVVFWYLSMVLVPNLRLMGLHHDDFSISHALFDPPITLFALGGIVLLIAGALVLRRKYSVAAFAILWFLGGHVLESTILPLELVAEHRNYLPSYGILFALFTLLFTTSVFRLNNHWRASIAVAAVALLATSTFVRANSWHSMDSLFASELINHPESPRNNYLAGWRSLQRARKSEPLQRINGLDRAREHLAKALALDPHMGQAAVALVCLHAEFDPANVDPALDRLQQSFTGQIPGRGSIASLEWLTNCAGAYPQNIPQERYEGIMNIAERSVRRSAQRRADIIVQLSRYHGQFRKDPKRALRHAERAVALNLKDSGLYLLLARWQLINRQLEAARKSLDLAREYDQYGRHRTQIDYLHNILRTLERNPAARIKIN